MTAKTYGVLHKLYVGVTPALTLCQIRVSAPLFRSFPNSNPSRLLPRYSWEDLCLAVFPLFSCSSAMLLLARSSENTGYILLPFILQFYCQTLRAVAPRCWEEWPLLGYGQVTHRCTAAVGRAKVIIWVHGHSLKCTALKLQKKIAEFTDIFFFFYLTPTISQPLRKTKSSFPKTYLSFSPRSQRLGEEEQSQRY